MKIVLTEEEVVFIATESLKKVLGQDISCVFEMDDETNLETIRVQNAEALNIKEVFTFNELLPMISSYFGIEILNYSFDEVLDEDSYIFEVKSSKDCII